MMEEKVNDDERLFVALQKLASLVKQAVEEAIADKKIVYEERLFQRKKVTGWPVELVYKPVLIFKGIKFWEFVEQIINREESRQALDILITACSKQEGYLRGYLMIFISKLIKEYLNQLEEGQKIDDSIAQQVVICSLKELEGEPLAYSAKVILQGVRLISEKINISSEAVLRQPREEDSWLESPFPPLLPEPPTLAEPTELTVMELEMKTTHERELQEKIEQISKFLRLFKIGCVKVIFAFIHSKAPSMIPIGTFPLNTLPSPTPYYTYTITQEDEEKLNNFWQEIEGQIPILLNSAQTEEHNFNYLVVANTFYEDALLREGRIEERIARAVMGLEALLLEDEQELAYRLSLRAAKLLGLLGFEATDVQNRIKVAYNIRSKYVHGTLLSHDEVQSRLRNISSPEDFLYSTLNYLRLLIITLLLSKIPKKCLLSLLDNSFIDPNKDKELKEKLSKAIEIVQEVKE